MRREEGESERRLTSCAPVVGSCGYGMASRVLSDELQFTAWFVSCNPGLTRALPVVKCEVRISMSDS